MHKECKFRFGLNQIPLYLVKFIENIIIIISIIFGYVAYYDAWARSSSLYVRRDIRIYDDVVRCMRTYYYDFAAPWYGRTVWMQQGGYRKQQSRTGE